MKVKESDIKSMLGSFDNCVYLYKDFHKEDLGNMIIYYDGDNNIGAVYLKEQKEELYYNAMNDFWYHYEVEK